MGALTNVRVVEFEALGPLSYAGMMLSDMGAEVVRIGRPGGGDAAYSRDRRAETMLRGRTTVRLDLRDAADARVARDLCAEADIVIEGLRPGAMERLGFGPAELLDRNPGLIYGRLTGWGQYGDASLTAGHDINYVSVTGALHATGHPEMPPTPALGLLGDIAGGALHLVLGICAALYERTRSGRGQVIDAAMTDGVAAMMTPYYGQLSIGEMTDVRGTNRLDGGAGSYRCYECADGRYLAVGPIEARFHTVFLELLGVGEAGLPDRSDVEGYTREVAAIIATRTRDEWSAVFAGTDACVSPVLTMAEAMDDAHLASRDTFVELDGERVPTPAPRFSRTPSAPGPFLDTSETNPGAVLAAWGQGG